MDHQLGTTMHHLFSRGPKGYQKKKMTSPATLQQKGIEGDKTLTVEV
jgi:hypothetical protein